MTTELLLLVLALLVVITLLYIRGLAGRLDRLHLRLEAADAALEARLGHRAALARELAVGGWLDPASALLLLDAATSAEVGGRRRSGEDVAAGDEVMARDAAQSDLSAALRAVLGDPEAVAELQRDPEARDLLADLAEAASGAVLARRFANDAVQAVLAVRRRWLVRRLHLAGHAPWPVSREMDDAPPPALAEIAPNAA